MPDLHKFFVTQESAPFQAGGQRIILVSQAVRLVAPQGFAGLIWNRPVAVRVQTEGGAEHVLPVVDLTRRWEIAILGLGLVVSILLALMASRKK